MRGDHGHATRHGLCDDQPEVFTVGGKDKEVRREIMLPALVPPAFPPKCHTPPQMSLPHSGSHGTKMSEVVRSHDQQSPSSRGAPPPRLNQVKQTLFWM